MLTKEDLTLLSQMMDEKLTPINNRLDKMDNRLDQIQDDIEQIKEDAQEVRMTVEEICKWIDLNFDYKYPFPIDKKII